MDIDFVSVTELADDRLPELSALLAAGFPQHPADLLEVELRRARELPLACGVAAYGAGALAGLALARQPRSGSLFLVHLVVDPASRRRGLGWRLVDELVTATGAVDVSLFVDHDNAAAQSLYARAGLVPDAGDAPAGQVSWSGRWHLHSSRLPSTSTRVGSTC